MAGVGLAQPKMAKARTGLILLCGPPWVTCRAASAKGTGHGSRFGRPMHIAPGDRSINAVPNRERTPDVQQPLLPSRPRLHSHPVWPDRACTRSQPLLRLTRLRTRARPSRATGDCCPRWFFLFGALDASLYLFRVRAGEPFERLAKVHFEMQGRFLLAAFLRHAIKSR